MEGIARREEAGLSLLDGLTAQGQMFLLGAAQNLIQFGRVLTEAKQITPRGQFEKWVQTSFGMSPRTAQNYMAAWQRFGGREQFQSIQFSNLQKMLALPEGAEEAFAETNDVEHMTAREVDEAVKKVRREAQEALERERDARRAAERRVDELINAPLEIPSEVLTALSEKDAEIAKYRNEVDRIAIETKEMLAARNDAFSELSEAQRELDELNDMLKEKDEKYRAMQSELLSAQSALAKGDAERNVSDQLTAEEFAACVRMFMSSVSQMPFMHRQFVVMRGNDEFQQFDQFLRVIEDWACRARNAMNTVEGEIIYGE